ncbi:MAG: hypothetical protein HUJ98_11460, partial [Bacteroidaceae bacterium]|nr:hypothetical protein [Bacteroidaceae bacterium]
KNNLVEVGSTIKAYADASKTNGYELYGSATLHQSQNPGYSAVFFLDDTCHRLGSNINIPGADYDYNDLVVYVAHSQQQYIPDIDEDQEVVTVPGAQKRYMVEDLGASQASDIDFNDIVIDFSESKTYIIKNTYVIENEVKVLVKTDTISTIYGQQAHVHALGGTKELCVYTTGAGGDKLVFRKSTYFDFRKMVNTGIATWDAAAKQIVWDYSGIKYDEKDKLVTNLPVEGWIPDENNIKVVVDDNNYDQYYDATGQLVYTHTTTEGAELRIPAPAVAWDVMFPQMGKAPSIIATNVSQRWNGERMSVFEPCESYFDETLQSYISTNPIGANLNPLFEEAKQGGGN